MQDKNPEFEIGREYEFVESLVDRKDGKLRMKLCNGVYAINPDEREIARVASGWLKEAVAAGYQSGRADGIREANINIRASGGHSNGALKEFFCKRLKQCEDMVDFLNQVLAEHRAHASDTEQNIRSAEARMSVYQNLMDELLGEGK